MNITIELTASPVFLDAILRLTAALSGGSLASAKVEAPVETLASEKPKRQVSEKTVSKDLAKPADPVETSQASETSQTVESTTVSIPSIEQIRAAVREKGLAGKKDEAKALLDSFGVERIPDLPENVRADFLVKVEAL